MKKLLFILPLLAQVACSRPVHAEPSPLPADSLMLRVMRAIMDTNLSCLDVQEEFYALIDTMQTHAMSLHDESLKIGVRSFALNMAEMFLFGDFCSPVEIDFFYHSLASPLANVLATWYSPLYAGGAVGFSYEPVLTNNIVFRYDGEDENRYHIIDLDLYILPDSSECMAITLPLEAECLGSVLFNHGKIEEHEYDTTAVFNMTNALRVAEKHEDLGQTILFGKELIEAMLTHEWLYIYYIGNENSDDIKDRLHGAHLALDLFHKQYQEVKNKIN